MKPIQDVYSKFINLMKHAVKKAQTVARRNAMRSHPALGPYATLTLDDHGRAVLPVRGWAMTADAERQWEELADRLERGQPLPELAEILDIEVDEISESYDPAKETVPADVDEGTPISHEEDVSPVARLREQVERGLDVLGPDAGTYGYSPGETYTEDQLNQILRAISADVDKETDR